MDSLPRREPPTLLSRPLNDALHDVLGDPGLKKMALDLGINAKASTPAELEARLRSDIEKWGTVIARANIPKQ